MMDFLETLSLLLAGDQFVIHFPTPTSFLNVRGIDEMNRVECRINSACYYPWLSQERQYSIKFNVKVPTYQW